jgi:hypothetical protein
MDSSEVEPTTRDAEKEKALSLMDDAFLCRVMDIFSADVISLDHQSLCDREIISLPTIQSKIR